MTATTTDATTQAPVRLAFAVPDLGPSQASFLLIKAANDWLAGSPQREVLVFSENWDPPCYPPTFSRFQMADLMGYHHPVVATTFQAAALALQSPSRKKVLYYFQDLEWMRVTRDYSEWRSVFANPLVVLAARSLDHARAALVWGKPVSVVEAFDMPSLLNLAYAGGAS